MLPWKSLINTIEDNSLLKSAKEAIRFGVTIFKYSLDIESNIHLKFWWRLAAYLDTSNRNNCKRMVSITKNKFTTEIESTRYE